MILSEKDIRMNHYWRELPASELKRVLNFMDNCLKTGSVPGDLISLAIRNKAVDPSLGHSGPLIAREILNIYKAWEPEVLKELYIKYLCGER